LEFILKIAGICEKLMGKSLGKIMEDLLVKPWENKRKSRTIYGQSRKIYPMTDPWCWYINANIDWGYIDGIHGTPI
jgi:hypothetical protein